MSDISVSLTSDELSELINLLHTDVKKTSDVIKSVKKMSFTFAQSIDITVQSF